MASERDDLTIHFQSSIEKLCEDHEDQFDKWHAERGYTTGRAKWKARALAAEATIARLEAEVEAGRADTARLAWLEAHKNAVVSHEGFEDNVWQVHTVNGGRSDREWTKRGEGDTLREAIDAARAALRASREGDDA